MSVNGKLYEVKKNDKLGRYLVANKDFESGEKILTDEPYVVGPKPDSPPLCLGCYKPCDGSAHCGRCGWPSCGEPCAAVAAHVHYECRVFTEARVAFQHVDDWTAPCLQYDCITPLRMLLEKEKDPERWERGVAALESHESARRLRPAWDADDVNVVSFLLERCKLHQRFGREVIEQACGILEVNSVEIPFRGGLSIRAIYPQLALASHSCVPNIVHTIISDDTSQYSVHVRAAINIKKGEALKLCYTYALYPTLLRRDFLLQSKFFECDCERCSDPLELNTHMSSLKCNKCDNGLLLASNPLNKDAEWRCSHCPFSSSGGAVAKILGIVQGEVDQVEESEPGPSTVEKREELLKKYRSVFHPKHALLIGLKHSLAQMYGRVEGYTLDELPDIMLERKAELCKQVLQVLDVVTPGQTRMRGMMLYELHAPLMFLARNEYKCGIISTEKLKERMNEPIKLLEQSALILGREDPQSAEGIVGRVAAQSADQLKASLQQI